MEKKTLKGRLDYTAMIIPLLGVVLLCVLFMIMPAKSSYIIQMIRGFLGNDCGIYYAMLGVGIFACSLYIAFSKYGKIKLGKDTDKPIYSSFNWGVMIFTPTTPSTLFPNNGLHPSENFCLFLPLTCNIKPKATAKII